MGSGGDLGGGDREAPPTVVRPVERPRPRARPPARDRAILRGVAAAVAFGAVATLVVLLTPPSAPPMPSPTDRATLLALARAHALGEGAVSPASPLPTAPPGTVAVIVTAYRPGLDVAPVGVWRDVRGRDLGAAVADAADELGRRLTDGRDLVRLRIDLTGDERRLHWLGAGALDALLDPGVDGVVTRDAKPAPAYAGPSIEPEFGDDGAGLADGVAQEAGAKSRWSVRLARFRAASFVESPDHARALPLVRGVVLPPRPPTAADLRGGAALAARYLADKVQDDGSFVYDYDATRDRDLGGYNLPRHCATVMAMFQDAAVSHDETVIDAAKRALAWIDGAETRDSRYPDAGFLHDDSEGGHVKLGAVALGVLAYVAAEKAGVSLAPEQRDRLERLGRGVLAMQRSDGELASWLDAPPDVRSQYFPGEATLALMALYERDHDALWLSAARRSADFQIDRRWKWAGVEIAVPLDAWLAQALDRLHVATGDARYARYALRIADEMSTGDFGAGAPPDYAGAFFTFDRVAWTTPASSRNEGVIAAARIAARIGDARAAGLRAEALDAAWFGLARQLRDDDAFACTTPSRAIGGVRDSVASPEVRIDGVQHAMSGWLALADLLDVEASAK